MVSVTTLLGHWSGGRIVIKGKKNSPLRHLLEDEQTLLNDFYSLGTADKFLFLLDKDLLEVVAIEVIGAMEVVKAVEGFEASPSAKASVILLSCCRRVVNMGQYERTR